MPGAVLGAYLTNYLSRGVFQYVFGAVLLLVAAYLMARPQSRTLNGILLKWRTTRRITDHQQNVHSYAFNLPIGMVIAFFVGIISGLLGIGGGIIHVPALTQILGFPAHIATATSHFMVAIGTFTAIDTHLALGTYTGDIGLIVLVLSAGAVVGAQFGARLSQRVTGVLIVRLLAVGLALVALRLLIAPF